MVGDRWGKGVPNAMRGSLAQSGTIRKHWIAVGSGAGNVTNIGPHWKPLVGWNDFGAGAKIVGGRKRSR